MFWKLSFRQPSAIDALLDKEECSLKEILDEDDVLQECKTHNKRLIDFLIRPEILEELVRMICQPPAEDADDKAKFKYPHLACELLTAEVYNIVEKLSTTETLLNLLWAFLDSTDQLDPLIGSFISKVLAMLLNKEGINAVILDFVRSHEQFIAHFLNHLGTSAMMDLLLQMVAAHENDQIRIQLAEWLREQGIVESLVDLVGNQAGPEQCVNASVALCEMIRLSRENYQKSFPAPLHDVLESEDTMKKLLSNMFSTDTPTDVVIVHGINILLTALERSSFAASPVIGGCSSSSAYLNQSPESMIQPNTPTQPIPPPPGMESVLSVILPYLKDFHKLLSRRPEIAVMHTTVGILDPPLGNTRLQVVRLFSSLLQCNNSTIESEIIKLKTYKSLLDLFFEYPWNNFLHMTVECCIMSAFSFQAPLSLTLPQPTLPSDNRSTLVGGVSFTNQNTTSEGKTGAADATQEGGGASQPDEGEEPKEAGLKSGEVDDDDEHNHKSLMHHLLVECQLIDRLLGGAEKNETTISSPGGRRLGYMGHLVRIANNVARSSERGDKLKEIVKVSLDDETQQRWKNFINGPLTDMNKKNEANLGGNCPVIADDSDEEFESPSSRGGPVDTELDKAYQQFLEVKYVTTIMEDYGVEDELNPSEEPFDGAFTRLMDIAMPISADEEQTQSANIFEQACSEKIQQFDDADSDEDDESSTWNENNISFISPIEQEKRSGHSISSGDEDEFDKRRELQTGSSDEEDITTTSKRAAIYMTSGSNTVPQMSSHPGMEPDRMEIDNTFGGVISWRSDIATDEDLSGVTALDTGGTGLVDWTKEPDSPTKSDENVQSSRTNWADFKSAFENKDHEPELMDLEEEHHHKTKALHQSKSHQQHHQSSPSSSSSVTHSHITVTYLSRTNQESPSSEGDDDLLESPKHRVVYRPLDDQSSPIDVDNIEVNVGGADSSDEENNTSSDSDEEKSGKYVLNMSSGSDNDYLLNSPRQDNLADIIATTPPSSSSPNPSESHDLQPLTPPTSHSQPTSSSSSSSSTSNGLEQEQEIEKKTLSRDNVYSSGRGTESSSPKIEEHQKTNTRADLSPNTSRNNNISSSPDKSSNSESVAGNKDKETVMARGDKSSSSQDAAVVRGTVGEGQLADGHIVDEKELQDNFSFLSRGMLSADGHVQAATNERRQLIEQKRSEAVDLCLQYEREVQKQES